MGIGRMNIFKLLELVICKYYENNKIVLISTIIIVLTGGYCFVDKQDLQQIKNKVATNFLYSLLVSVSGYIVNMINGSWVAYENFNVMFFMMLSALTTVYTIYEYWKCVDPYAVLRGICKRLRYVLLCELFILASSSHLDLLEYVTALLVIIFCNILQEERQNSIVDEPAIESDYATDQLFSTRKKQLEKFIPVLKEQTKEPYAVMISGEWGTGKTSFTKALKKQMESDAYFIDIEAGAEKTASEIMDGICTQIIDILKKNGIEKKDRDIQRYFSAFAENTEGIVRFFPKIIEIFEKRTEPDWKEYINSLLLRLEKTIYIVIDDLDRCDDYYQQKMFKVIRESLDINRCKTIFLIDERHFLNATDISGDNYLRKYVSCKLELCKMQYDEIVNELFDEIFKEDSFANCRDCNLQDVRSTVLTFHNEIIREIKSEIEGLQQKTRKEKIEENREKLSETIKEYETMIRNTTGETENARNVKKYLKEIKRNINNLAKDSGVNKDKFSNNDIKKFVRVIIGVQYIKSFIPEKYFVIKVRETIKGYHDWIVNTILGIKQDAYSSANEKDVQRIDYVLFRIDVDNFPQIQTQEERILSELRDPKCRKKENVLEYLKYAYTYSDLSIVLDLLNSIQSNVNEQGDITDVLLDSVRVMVRGIQWTIDDVFDVTEKIALLLSDCLWTERQKNVYRNKSIRIAREVIRSNRWRIENVFALVYGPPSQMSPEIEEVKVIRSFWEKLADTDLENENEPKKIIHSIEEELKKLKKKLTSSENLLKKVQINLDDIFKKINIVLGLYIKWTEIAENFCKEKTVEESITKLIQYGKRNERDIVKNPDELEETLESLAKEYEEGKCRYEDYVDVLEQLTRYLAQEDNLELKSYNKDRIKELLTDSIRKCNSVEELDEYTKRQNENIKVWSYNIYQKLPAIEQQNEQAVE